MPHLLDQVVIVIWQWLGCSSCQLGFMPEKASSMKIQQQEVARNYGFQGTTLTAAARPYQL
jgi:hypothetical protein